MDYQLYEHSDILLNENSDNSKNSWNLQSECSMDNNSDLFGWSGLKIEEQDKVSKKRRLSTENEAEEKKNSKQRALKTSIHVNGKPTLKKTNAYKNAIKMQQWQVDDYGDLNTDIENSLSIGTNDLVGTSYSVSESILAMNGLTVFKQEAPSPTSSDITTLHVAQKSIHSPTHHANVAINSTVDDNNTQNMFSNTINQLLSQGNILQNVIENNSITSPNSQDGYTVTSTNFNLVDDKRFQYVLAAATSIATKQNEDTLTYLNQGQSYEIKLKKLGDLSYCRGKILKSYIRICFHERRLQYMEKEQMLSWQSARPGDRILEVDIPLSYGAYDIVQPSNALNMVHFNWDPTKEVGVYIKVNCISTEFTAKKHGGEKGVPFRIQVETYLNHDQNSSTLQKRLHAAACQIKVFKLKGADRKHKQDREKITKRPVSEQEKYQPSYDCTVLNDLPNDITLSSPPLSPTSTDTSIDSSPQVESSLLLPKVDSTPVLHVVSKDVSKESVPNPLLETKETSHSIINNAQLSQYSTPEETTRWLLLNRFEKYLETFERFSGDDMFRMSREDLIHICGSADGIRMHNAIHLKAISPKLKMYVCRENSSFFNAVFLTSHNNEELIQKLSTLIGIPRNQIRDVYLEGPQSIHIQLNNDVLEHIKEETMFSVLVMPQENNGGYALLLKRTCK